MKIQVDSQKKLSSMAFCVEHENTQNIELKIPRAPEAYRRIFSLYLLRNRIIGVPYKYSRSKFKPNTLFFSVASNANKYIIVSYR